MPTELKMPALSPTMEEGTLAKWLVKEGDTVKSGDILAEIETDKATMEFEAVDEGTIAKILVPEGTDGVKVGTPIAMLAGEGEDASAAAAPAPAPAAEGRRSRQAPAAEEPPSPPPPRQGRRRNPAPRRAAPAALSPRGERATGSRLSRWRAAWPKRRASTSPRSRARARRADRSRRPRHRRRVAPWPRRSATVAVARGCSRVAAEPARRHPARGRQAFEHAQDDRAPPDRIEAAGPAHLSDGRHPARRAAQAARRAQCRAREPRHQAVASTTC